MLAGSTWQRCRVHSMRNLLATVPQGARGDRPHDLCAAGSRLGDDATAKGGRRLRTRFSRAATVLEAAAEDILAYRHLPVEHQGQLHSTNPLEG